MNDYSIELGVKLNTGDITSEIAKIEKNKIKLGVDVKVDDIRKRISVYNQNTNNAKLKLGVTLDTKGLSKQIGQLGIGKDIAIPINTESLESSLREVKDIIHSIKTSLGTIDDSGDMKSIVTSVNQIASALEKATNESDGLVASLSALSKKDFNFNLGLDVGKKNSNNMIAYGRTARKQVIPELEFQIKELEGLFGGQQATMSKLTSKGNQVGFDVFTDFTDFNSESAIKKMEAMEKYINSLKKLASIEKVDLGDFNNIHKDASELINSIAGIENAVNKAQDVPEKLKTLLGGSVDGEQLSIRLDSIVADLNEIKIVLQGLTSGVSFDGLTQSFDRLSSTLEQLMTNAKLVQDALGSGMSGTSIANQTQEVQKTANAYKEVANEVRKLNDVSNNISIDIPNGDINELKNALRNISINDSSISIIDNTTDKLREMGITAKSVSATLQGEELIKLDVKGIQTIEDGLRRVVTVTNNLDKAGNPTQLIKYAQTLDDIAIAADKVNQKLNSGSKGNTIFDVEIGKVESDFNKLINKSDELRDKIEEVKQSFADIQTASATDDVNKVVEANERYEKILQDVQNQLKLTKQEEQRIFAADNLELTKQRQLLILESLFEDGSEAARKYASDVDNLAQAINNCTNDADMGKLTKQVSNLRKEVDNSGAKTKTLGQELKEQWDKYKSYLSVASLVSYGTQAMRSMFEQVKLIDSAMTELKKVTNETDESYERFLTNAASRAKEIGTTIDGLVESTADFARLGYNFKDAQGLAEVANIYAVVGDDIASVEQATKSLISTLTAFKNEMGDMDNTEFALSIVDKMNEVANNFAISSGGIGEALARSASSMMAANNSLDETIALITAANTVVDLCHLV